MTDPSAQLFSNLLQRFMQLKDITDTGDLADLTGISQGTLDAYLAGERTPSAHDVRRVAELYGMEPATVMHSIGLQPEENPFDRVHDAIETSLGELTAQDKLRLIGLLAGK